MAYSGVTYWGVYALNYKVQVLGQQENLVSRVSEEEGRGTDTWDTEVMEVKGHLITGSDSVRCEDSKRWTERMSELQDRRRNLQTQLSTRLAELKRICIQEAELTGAVPTDYPVEGGEKRGEEERVKLRKTLFSGALRRHTDSQHNTHTHNSKRTVHRGCHTDDTVKSESSSTSDSTGHDNECHPLVYSVSPVELYYHDFRNRKNSMATSNNSPSRVSNPEGSNVLTTPLLSRNGQITVHIRAEEGQNHRLLPQPNFSPDGSSPSVPSQPGGREGDGDRCNEGGVSSEEEEGGVNGHNRTANHETGRRAERGRGGYSDILLDYIWSKQQKTNVQRQHSQGNSRQPIVFQHYGESPAAPAVSRNLPCDTHRAKVTRTKSCGPFPQQHNQADLPPHHSAHPHLQPDPHPHLHPPSRPPPPPPNQEGQLEEATRNLHKALALEGLRDWYLRNSLASGQSKQQNGKVNAKVKGPATGGGALQRRRTTHGSTQISAYQMETNLQYPPTTHHKPATHLPHSATFHGHPLHGRSMDNSLYQDSFPAQKQEMHQKEKTAELPSPGTLV